MLGGAGFKDSHGRKLMALLESGISGLKLYYFVFTSKNSSPHLLKGKGRNYSNRQARTELPI